MMQLHLRSRRSTQVRRIRESLDAMYQRLDESLADRVPDAFPPAARAAAAVPESMSPPEVVSAQPAI